MDDGAIIKLGGLSALLTALGMAVGVVLGVMSGTATNLDTSQIGPWLASVNQNRGLFLASRWLFFFSTVFFLAAAVGLYKRLRLAQASPKIAFGAVFTGVLFLFASDLLLIAMGYELVPGYFRADPASRPALELMARYLLVLSGGIAWTLGNLFALGIGVLAFSVAILRNPVVPRWVGWLGLLSAVLGGWLGAPASMAQLFFLLRILGATIFTVWIALVGIYLLRWEEGVS